MQSKCHVMLLRFYLWIDFDKNLYEYQYFEYQNISFKEVWPQRSLKVTKVHPILALTQPFPLMDGPLMLPPQIVCISLFFLTLHLILYSPLFLLLSFYTTLYLSLLLYEKLIYILKGHIKPLLCRMIFNDFQIFWSNYNLDLFLSKNYLSWAKNKKSISVVVVVLAAPSSWNVDVGWRWDQCWRCSAVTSVLPG